MEGGFAPERAGRTLLGMRLAALPLLGLCVFGVTAIVVSLFLPPGARGLDVLVISAVSAAAALSAVFGVLVATPDA